MAISRREREREERRMSILDAAEPVFLAKGPANATMDEIAAGAELSKGTLYLYFKSKDELYLAIVLRTLQKIWPQMKALAEDTTRPGIETLVLLAKHHADFARKHRDHFRLGHAWMQSGYVVAAETRNFEDYRRLINNMFMVSVEAIMRGQSDGSVRPDIDAYSFCVQMWGSIVGLTMLSLNQAELVRRLGREMNFPELIDSFIELVIGSIKAPSDKETSQ